MKKIKFLRDYISEFKFLLESCDLKNFDIFSEMILETKKKNKKIIIIGNGGSASICSHFSVDLTKNAKVRCINFNEANLITCFSNDYGFENWLKKSIEYYAEPGDMLISISSSGKSINILNASKYFKSNLGQVVTFTGNKKNNNLKKIGNLNFWVDSKSYNIIENIHQFWLLMCIDLIIGKKNYKSNL
jgi:D-sedoheptulose 7-phosphate isomerase